MNPTLATPICSQQLHVLVPDYLVNKDSKIVDKYIRSLIGYIKDNNLLQQYTLQNRLKNPDTQKVLNYYRELGYDVDYTTKTVHSSTPLLIFMKIKRRSHLASFELDSQTTIDSDNPNKLQELICKLSLALVNLFDKQTLEAILDHNITFESLFQNSLFSHCFIAIISS
jgi:hypothetical protein